MYVSMSPGPKKSQVKHVLSLQRNGARNRFDDEVVIVCKKESLVLICVDELCTVVNV